MSTRETFYVTSGAVGRTSLSYVERRADGEILRALKGGEYCYVLTPRQMGKTSLVVRTGARLREAGVAVANVDLSGLGQESVKSAEQWYRTILRTIGQQLGLGAEMLQFWRDHRDDGPLDRLMQSLQQVVLERIHSPVVIFIDEVDAVRSLSREIQAGELFVAIRALYNKRATDERLERLTFCLLGVASLSDLIENKQITPFNIGEQVELTDFEEGEAAPLIAGLGRGDEAGATLLRRILYWTGGHPYLTQNLCKAVADDAGVTVPADVDRVCHRVFLSNNARLNDRNLIFVRESLLESNVNHDTLLDLYSRVHRQTDIVRRLGGAFSGTVTRVYWALRGYTKIRDEENSPFVTVLRLSGITRVVGDLLAVRNRIYYRVFDRRWIATNTTDKEKERQRAAFVRGARRIGVISAIVLAVVGSLAVLAVYNQREAERQRVLAVVQQELAQQKAAEAEEARAQTAEVLGQVERAKSEADRQREIAEEQRRLAESNLAESKKQRALAEEQRSLAQRNFLVAEEQRKLAQKKSEEAGAALTQAVEQQLIATAAKEEAQRQRDVAQASRAMAERQRLQAEVAQQRNSHLLYSANIYLAQQAFDAGDNKRGTELLLDIKENQRELLGFEWYYLRAAYDQGLATISGHADYVRAVAFSHQDGGSDEAVIMATASDDGTVKLWDVTGASAGATPKKEIATLDEHTGYVRAVAFAPDDKSLVSAGDDHVAIVWDVSDPHHPKEKFRLKGHQRAILAVAYSRNNKLIATGSADRNAKLWDAATGREVATLTEPKKLPEDIVYAHDGAVLSLSFSSEAVPLLVTGSSDATAKVWDTANAKLLATLRGHTGAVNAVAFSQDVPLDTTDPGRRFQAALEWPVTNVLTGGEDGTVRIWEPKSSSPPTDEALSPAGGSPLQTPAPPDSWRALAEIGLTPQPGNTLRKHAGAVYAVAFAPGGRNFASAGRDRTIKLWSRYSIGEVATLRGHALPVLSLAFSPKKGLLASGGWDKTVKLWNVTPLHAASVLKGHLLPILSLAYNPSYNYLATGGKDNDLLFWDTLFGIPVWNEGTTASGEVGGHRDTINAVAVSPDGETTATASWDHTVALWDAKPAPVSGIHVPRLRRYLKGHEGSVNALAFSPDSETLATGSDDKTVKLWDAKTGKELYSLDGHAGAVKAVAFAPDGKMLASAGDDGTAKLWDMATRKEVKTFAGHTDFVNGLAFSPDGETLATASSDNSIKLWDIASGKEAGELKGHESYVRAVAFSHDGRTLASGSNDGTVRLWDVTARKELLTLRGHTGYVSTVAFAPGDMTLASAGSDQTVRLWRAPRTDESARNRLADGR
jgi:WD40 repeat protein